MECPKCKQFNVPAKNCVRCNAPLYPSPLGIDDRITDAVAAYNTIAMCGPARLVSATVMASDTYDMPAQPNILYIGSDEFHALIVAEAFGPYVQLSKLNYKGMRVIRVRLQTWLQVTYVEGL